MAEKTPEMIAKQLAQPFHPEEIHWKPGAVSGARALAMAYIDARAVMDRLDEVVGPWGWQEEYQQLADGSMICRLTVKIGGEWITKSDVGGQSEQQDGGDRTKASVSDALKRTGVKFGIGRYLYHLPATWCDFDPKSKKILKPPQLPAWAIPQVDPAEEREKAFESARLILKEGAKKGVLAMEAVYKTLSPIQREAIEGTDEMKDLVAIANSVAPRPSQPRKEPSHAGNAR